ncbi:HAMP domain-containing protein [Waterburya agarophytonicola K14]|uniref:HAMP domain-containing protein n=1 Tax=Waterburya agarophytonicola KI4 TaxID=2874699 RepID=A0A964BSN4_9CYAN|nr:methyl-accepting chemotaxis protein [Waterburya agarophytonicola]MCC0177497.1 HAMP domain-containing protein [Waterburya agarophytonicola KI4]
MKLSLFKSLQFRLPFLVLLGVIPTTIIAIAFANSNASKIIRQETQENLALKAEALDENVSRWTQMNILSLKNLTLQPGVRSLDPQQQKPILETVTDTYEYIYLAHTADLNGLNIARSDDKPANNYSTRLWLKEVKAGNKMFLQTLIGKTSKKPTLCLAAPINKQTTLSAVAVICSVLEELTQQIGAVKFGKTGYGFIVDEQGRILGHPDPNLTSGDELTDYSNYPPVANLLSGEEGSFPFQDESGIEWISHGNRLDNGWGVFILQQKSEAFLQEKEFQHLATLIAGVSILMVGLLTWFLASRLTKPISKITAAATNFAEGNLDQKVELSQDDEIGILADSFNTMAQQLQESIIKIESKAEEQSQEKRKLEEAIYTLLDEVSDATDGDLTVRANLDSMELSTVADLFNAIIDNLQDIAIEAKESSSLVGSSLQQNELAIRLLAEQAIDEAKETRDTLMSVEQMSQSIQAVSENASQAEKITDDTYNTIVNSTKNMDLTVASILELRSTVGETSKKMKRLGESSQKISQAVSFIEEIALRTNVLAINASVEAGRAGEYGQGFTIVAEQVGALAEQSAAATKEIANIVAAIQAETQEVNQAMESGTTQVVETTRLVENTKQGLNLVLAKSQEVNRLMGSISQSTISQADTSQNITKLMQKIATLSETTSQSSAQVAQSIVETAKVAQKLESTVGQFKVAE